MSTFPRRVKLKLNQLNQPLSGRTPDEPVLTRTVTVTRPASDLDPTSTDTLSKVDRADEFEHYGLEFDAGLNSSAAWTEHLHVGQDGPGSQEVQAESVRVSESDAYGDTLSLSDGTSDRTITLVNIHKLDSEAHLELEGQLENNINNIPYEYVDPTSGAGRPARVLYDFPGNPSARELSLRAGEEIEVLQESINIKVEGVEDVNGWSLARVMRDGRGERDAEDRSREQDAEVGVLGQEREEEVGLVPRAYYAFTTDFISSPGPSSEFTSTPSIESIPSSTFPTSTTSTTSITTSTNPSSNPNLIPQNTGEWFKQQMRSILLYSGRSLSTTRSLFRSSRFVSSGAEAFVLHGPPPLPPPSGSGPSSRVSASQSSKLPLQGDGITNGPNDGLPFTSRLSTYQSLPIHSLPSTLSTLSTHSHQREPTAPPPETSPDTHYVDADAAGPMWREKVPRFEVRVRDPRKVYPILGGGETEAGAFIVYSVVSIFDHSPPSSSPSTSDESDDEDLPPHPPSSTHTLTVPRRFSHFVLLHQTLSSYFPSLALPPLPPKQFSGRLNSEFVEVRRRELERWLKKVVSHPVTRYSEPVRVFLGCEDEVEFRRLLPTLLHRSPSSSTSSSSSDLGRAFYANVYHPPFQVDLEDATETGERFENHLRAVSRGVQGLRGTFGKVRGARLEMSSAERLLSYELLSLITSRPLSTSSGPSVPEDETSDEESMQNANGEDRQVQGPRNLTSPKKSTSPDGRQSDRRGRGGSGRKKGLQNADGAWCWREECPDCMRLTKCVQKTAETLQGVADLFDGHARRTMFETEDSLKDVAHPDTIYSPVLDIHKQTLERYKAASKDDGYHSFSDTRTEASANGINRSNTPNDSKLLKDVNEDEDSIAARCETVLNTTLAELDVYHSEKAEGIERVVKRHLDGEIAFYEKVLTRLRTTRALFDAPPAELALLMPGPRAPSIYERELQSNEALTACVAKPLERPAPHVLDNKGSGMGMGMGMAVKPVSEAMRGLLGFAGSGSGSGEK